ncbi:MAG: CBS domain-containing protein [Candidatus Woesearchaeota archaeon]
MKKINIDDIINRNFEEIDGEENVTKVSNKLTDSKDVLVVKEDSKYKGVITYKDLVRNNVKSETKVKNIARNSPTIKRNEDLLRVTTLMMSSSLFHLPVVENNAVLGIIDGDKVIEKALQNIDVFEVKDVMTENTIRVDVDDSLAKALVTLRENNISRILVQQEEKIVGIITIKDIIEKALKPKYKKSSGFIYDQKTSMSDIKVKEFMQTNLITINPQDKITVAFEKMKEKDVSSLIVKGKKAGILTKKDIIEKISYDLKEEKQDVYIQISSKMELDKELIIEEIKEFVEKSNPGPGYIYVHVTKHKETYKKQKLLHCRLRLRCKEQHDVTAEGFGEDQMIANALTKLKTTMVKHDKRILPKDLIEYTNISAL